MTLFDMFNKAAGLTEDAKKYNTGDISEKTGLQKQPDGSWKPPKAKGSQPKGTDKKVKTTYGSASRLFETKLPPKVSFHSKDRQTEILNNIAKRKSQSGKVSESDLSIPHEEVKEHLNASKYYKQKAKGFTKTDPSYKKYLAKAEEYENKAKAAADDYGLDFSEFIDDSAPLTADTKIKLSQIKTTDDAGFEEGHVSHRKNGDFVKQGGNWVPVKKNGQGNKKQAETQSSTTGIPSPELEKKRLERAEKRNAERNATRTNGTEQKQEEYKEKDFIMGTDDEAVKIAEQSFMKEGVGEGLANDLATSIARDRLDKKSEDSGVVWDKTYSPAKRLKVIAAIESAFKSLGYNKVEVNIRSVRVPGSRSRLRGGGSTGATTETQWMYKVSK